MFLTCWPVCVCVYKRACMCICWTSNKSCSFLPFPFVLRWKFHRRGWALSPSAKQMFHFQQNPHFPFRPGSFTPRYKGQLCPLVVKEEPMYEVNKTPFGQWIWSWQREDWTFLIHLFLAPTNCRTSKDRVTLFKCACWTGSEVTVWFSTAGSHLNKLRGPGETIYGVQAPSVGSLSGVQ